MIDVVEYARLGEALQLPGDKYGKRLRPVLGLIDSVHGVRTIHRLPVRITRNKRNEGEYHYKPGSFEPDYIEVSRINDSMEATLLHEVGHFLEIAVIPGCSYGQRQWTGPITAEWLDAILATEAVKTIQRLADPEHAVQLDGEGRPIPPKLLSRVWLDYLVTPRELWARSYAQWIAGRSDDENFRKFFTKFSSPSAIAPLQWSSEDFAAVEEQFDRIFSALGWLR